MPVNNAALAKDKIRVFLVDDHQVVREGLVSLLNREPDMTVVGQAESAEAALEALPTAAPAVVVLDQQLPGATGVEMCRRVFAEGLDVRIVMLSTFMERGAVDQALAAGASACVLKDVDGEELKTTIRRAAAEDAPVADRDDKSAGGVLGRQNARLLALLVEGASVVEMSRDTGLARNTVHTYLKELYKTLGVNSRAEAAAVAVRRGLV
jgi:two-component system response regulator DevR